MENFVAGSNIVGDLYAKKPKWNNLLTELRLGNTFIVGSIK